jgi:hypothetical protein
MNEIRLALTLDEVNQILESLGSRPYAEVFKLVAKIQQQAGAQLNPAPTVDAEDTSE